MYETWKKNKQGQREGQCINYRTLKVLGHGQTITVEMTVTYKNLLPLKPGLFAYTDQQIERIGVDPVYNKDKVYKKKKSYHCSLKGGQQTMKIPKQIWDV